MLLSNNVCVCVCVATGRWTVSEGNHTHQLCVLLQSNIQVLQLLIPAFADTLERLRGGILCTNSRTSGNGVRTHTVHTALPCMGLPTSTLHLNTALTSSNSCSSTPSWINTRSWLQNTRGNNHQQNLINSYACTYT